MSSQRSSKEDYDADVSGVLDELAAWLVEASERPEAYCTLANIFAAGKPSLYNPPSNQKAIEQIFSRLCLVLCAGRDDSALISQLSFRLGHKRSLLMHARLWSTEELPRVQFTPSGSPTSSVSNDNSNPSFTQYQTESYTASLPSLSSLEPDENRVDSNRTSATPYSFGSDAKKVRWKRHRRVYRRVHAQVPKDEQRRVRDAEIKKQRKEVKPKKLKRRSGKVENAPPKILHSLQATGRPYTRSQTARTRSQTAKLAEIQQGKASRRGSRNLRQKLKS